MKKPVIRTRTAGFDDSKYCIPIDKDNPDDLASKLEQLVLDNSVLYKFTDEAFNFAINNLTAKEMTLRTIEVYKKAVNDLNE